MLILVVLASIFCWSMNGLRIYLLIILFYLSSSDPILPKLYLVFEGRMSYYQGNVYKLSRKFLRAHCSGNKLDRLIENS